MKNKTSNRRLIFQLAAVVVLIAIAYAMTIVGRGHTVYLDNKKLEYNGKTYDTPYKVVVLVDGEQVAKLYDRERVQHSLYGKIMNRTVKFKAHDENNECGIGDKVRVMETRPLSKDKHWRMVEIIEKAK